MSIAMIFTPAACDYIKKMIMKENGVGLRLSIKKTGCSGYSYVPLIITEPKQSDLLLQQDGVSIYVDATWQHLFDGVTVDYAEDDKAGIRQKRLVFHNPKEANRCGCGESFTL
jgi:iron-sulfur cluster assembly accessory protein